MAKQFAQHAFQNRGKTFAGFTPDAEEGLRNYTWPGNVRELLNVVERTALVWEGHGPITAKALAITGGGSSSGFANNGAGNGGGTGKLELVKAPLDLQGEDGILSYTELKKRWSDSFEREYLTAILARHQGNVSAAAREAKIDRSNFLRLLRRHQLKAQEYRKVGGSQAA